MLLDLDVGAKLDAPSLLSRQSLVNDYVLLLLHPYLLELSIIHAVMKQAQKYRINATNDFFVAPQRIL